MTADLLTLTVNLGFLLAGGLLGFAAGMRFTSLSLKRERGNKPAETPADFGGFDGDES